MIKEEEVRWLEGLLKDGIRIKYQTRSGADRGEVVEILDSNVSGWDISALITKPGRPDFKMSGLLRYDELIFESPLEFLARQLDTE